MMWLDPKDLRISERDARRLERAAAAKANRERMLMAASRDSVLSSGRSAHWIVLRVSTGHEIAVENYLREAKVDAWLPLKEGRKTYRKGKPVEHPMRPIMPGYVLVRTCTTPSAMLALVGVDDVLGILGGGINPLKISDRTIERFRATLAHGDDGHCDADEWIEDGVKCRIFDGPFAGIEGRLTAFHRHASGHLKMKRGKNVKVVFSISGREVEVEMPLAFVEKK